jgi:hypothetical protein
MPQWAKFIVAASGLASNPVRDSDVSRVTALGAVVHASLQM